MFLNQLPRETGEADEAGEKILLERLDLVFERLRRALRRSGRKEDEVGLVAVSKRHELRKILLVAGNWPAWAKGPACGESYVQEALAKQELLASLQTRKPARGACPEIAWHFIGHAQSRKAASLAGRFRLIHSLDSLTLAQNLQKALEKRSSGSGEPERAVQEVLVQVNIGLEKSKSGVRPEEAQSFIEDLQAFPAISVQGLMCLPPYAEEAEASRPFFNRLRQMRDRLESSLDLKLPYLSMGMSHDFEVAVEEGATLVRVGTDIFGARQ